MPRRHTGGRPRKPTVLHHLQGTVNVTRLREQQRQFEPIAEGELGRAPPGLTAEQRANWRYAVEHAPKGVLKKIDRGIMRVWVEAEDRHAIASSMQAKIDGSNELKLLVRGPNGLKPSPYNRILKDTAEIMFRAAQELGFTPAARPRLKVEPAEPSSAPADDPWQLLKLVPGGKTD